MARIAIFANSKRPDGQCLAGFDLETREWVRPVPRTGDGIPTQRCMIGNRFIAVRDVVEMDLIRPRTISEFQRENHVVANWNWTVVGRLNAEAVERFIETDTPVLHTGNDRVDPAYLRTLDPREWKSLQLVRPRTIRFARHYFSPNRWVAHFEDTAGNSYSLKITDPIITRKLEAGQAISDNCLLTVSMAKAWTPNPAEKPPICYKLVATVIEL